MKFRSIRLRKYSLGALKRRKTLANPWIKLTLSKNSSIQGQRNNHRNRNQSKLRKPSKNPYKPSSPKQNLNNKYSKSTKNNLHINHFPTHSPQSGHLPLLTTPNPNKTPYRRLNKDPCPNPNKNTSQRLPRSKIQLK